MSDPANPYSYADFSNHYTTQFSTNWIHRLNQTKCRLDEFIVWDNYEGERKRYDRIGMVKVEERGARHEETKLSEADLDSRWALHKSFSVANLIDERDAQKLGSLVLPTSGLVQEHASAYNRKSDELAWRAAMGSVYYGKEGTATQNFNPDRVIPATFDGTTGTPNTGLTVAKLIEVNRLIDDADFEDDAPRVAVVTAEQIANLLADKTVTSSDYNTVRALAAGQIDTFMGFKFVRNKALEKTGHTRKCVFWVKGAVVMMRGKRKTSIDPRHDRSGSLQVRSSFDLGGTRVHDESVVVCDCWETKAAA